ncbi:MAG: hypothetical protein ABSC49_03375 [Candidatus Microgenomates bacterium]|jgi:hypothetical protein
MEEATNKRSGIIFWALGIFFVVALVTVVILTYDYTITQIACGKSAANPLLIVNTSDLPASYFRENYSFNIKSTLVGARTNLTATFSGTPEGLKIDPCTLSYNSDVAPTPNTTISCTLEGQATVIYTSGFKITGIFSAPDLKKTIQKDFNLVVTKDPLDATNQPNLYPN